MKWTCVAPRLASYIDLDHVNDLIEKVACWHYQSSIMNLTPVRKKIFMCEKDFWLHAFIALRSWDSLRVYLLRGHCLVSIFESFFLILLYKLNQQLIFLIFVISRSAASDSAGPQLHGLETTSIPLQFEDSSYARKKLIWIQILFSA